MSRANKDRGEPGGDSGGLSRKDNMQSMAQLSTWTESQGKQAQPSSSISKPKGSAKASFDDDNDELDNVNRGMQKEYNASVAQLAQYTTTAHVPPPVKHAPGKTGPQKITSLSEGIAGDEVRVGLSKHGNMDSMAQLSRWTEVQSKSISPVNEGRSSHSAKATEEDEYADEQFEDYEDDFEDAEEASPEKKPPPKAATKLDSKDSKDIDSYVVKPSASKPVSDDSTSRDPLKLLKEKQLMIQQNQQNQQSDVDDRRSSIKKFGGTMTLSQAGNHQFDPRHKRLLQLRDAKIFDMQEDKFILLNIKPRTKYELFNQLLKSETGGVANKGVPVTQDTRDIDIATDEIRTSDKSFQFAGGDDTEFWNAISKIRRQKGLEGGYELGEGKRSNSYNKASTANKKGSKDDIVVDKERDQLLKQGGSKLTSFVQNASRIVETLFVENQKSFNKDARSGCIVSDLFARDSSWVFAGDSTESSGANELIKTRITSLLRHSELRPRLFVTVHPYVMIAQPPSSKDKEGDKGAKGGGGGNDAPEADDLRPEKVFYCIWEAGSSQSPQYILQSVGAPTCITFSKTQWFIVVAGTSEGGLVLWDLREADSIHLDRDAVDLQIEHGIRKPSYSTNVKSQVSSAMSSHNAPLVQIDSIGDTTSSHVAVVSHFASLDSAGVLILWVTQARSERDRDNENEKYSSTASSSSARNSGDDSAHSLDLNISPWGNVRLVSLRCIDIYKQESPLRSTLSSFSSSSSSSSSLSLGVASLGPLSEGFASMFACIPGDQSTFLVVSKFGKINKINRYSNTPSTNSSSSRNATTGSSNSSLGSNSSSSSSSSGSGFDFMDRGTSYSSNEEYASAMTPREGPDDLSIPVESKSTTYRAEVSCLSVSSVIFNVTVASVVSNKLEALQGESKDESSNYSSKSDGVGGGNKGSNTSSHSAFEGGHTLVLSGRKDGTLDLFDLNFELPIYTWDLTSFDEPTEGGASKSSMKDKQLDSADATREVVYVKWSGSSAATSFVAVDSFGIAYLFDLSTSFDRPITIDRSVVDFKRYSKSSAFKKLFKYHKSMSSLLYSGKNILANLIDVSCESLVETQTAFMTVSDSTSYGGKEKDREKERVPACSAKTRYLNREIFPLTGGKHAKETEQKINKFRDQIETNAGLSSNSSLQVVFQQRSSGGRK